MYIYNPQLSLRVCMYVYIKSITHWLIIIKSRNSFVFFQNFTFW